MKPPLYSEVQEVTLNIVNASEQNNTQAQWLAYQELLDICEKNEASELNHPFQWETLGDFTNSTHEAIKIYNKALKYAIDKNLNNYVSSILFAIAELHFENENITESLEFATKANDIAKKTNDLELRREISAFLLERTKCT